MRSPALVAAISSQTQSGILLFLSAVLGIVFLWSAIRPYDYFTWMLEVTPGLAAVALLAATYPRFRFTLLAYWLIAVHLTILFVGGHYTYALVPLGEWMRETFGFARNHYDRIGHFAQGFVPAIVAREVLLRRSPLKNGRWLRFLVLCVCVAVSAVYELFEWRVAVWTGSRAEDFLGTQGDPWDTQKDMATALIGATTALILLSSSHDHQLRNMEKPAGDRRSAARV
jgi:putative membrane protein